MPTCIDDKEFFELLAAHRAARPDDLPGIAQAFQRLKDFHRQAIADERERCAQIADAYIPGELECVPRGTKPKRSVPRGTIIRSQAIAREIRNQY